MNSRNGGQPSLQRTSLYSQTVLNSTSKEIDTLDMATPFIRVANRLLQDGPINPVSHIFDAEAIGAWKGLQRTIRMPPNIRQRRLWLCIDSTSVIWGLRGEAPSSSQWAFHNCQDAMQTHDVRVRGPPQSL